MAKGKKKISLADKLGKAGAKAVKNRRDDETEKPKGGDLPAGINGGVAQLTSCNFGIFLKGDNKGEFYFMAGGTVVSPKTHAGQRIEGGRTQIGPEPLCDTPGRVRDTAEAHVGWVLNQLRLLGVDTTDLDVDDLEGAAEAIAEEMPFFGFRTWVGEKATKGKYKGVEPRINHVWEGECSYDEDGDDDDVDDNTDDDSKSGKKEKSLKQLGKDADDDDEDAQEKLTKLAKKAGIKTEPLADWAAVADAVENGVPEDDEDDEDEDEDEDSDDSDEDESEDDDSDDDDEDEEEEFEPSKGDVVNAKLPKKKKFIECEVTKVNSKKKTVSVRSSKDKKVYKDLPWDRLEEIED